jgi:4-aminobutyrate aminotransferase/(S)-3-amino-2-methylpropionate transaminase
MDSVHVGGLGGTFGGNPVAAAAAIAVLDKIVSEGLLERSRAVGETIDRRLRAMQDRFGAVGDVRGRGAMRAMELVADRATKEPLDGAVMGALGRAALERGVIVLTAGTYGNVVRLLPPVTIEDGLLDEGLDLLEEAVAQTAG